MLSATASARSEACRELWPWTPLQCSLILCSPAFRVRTHTRIPQGAPGRGTYIHGVTTFVANLAKRKCAQVDGRRRLGRTAQMYLTAIYLPNGYVQ
jgi:hypothetical protein